MFRPFVELSDADPAATALIERGQITSRAMLLRLAAEMAGALSAAGLQAGELLAIQLPNSVEFVAALLAALDLGLIIAPIDRDAPASEVTALISHFAISGFMDRGLTIQRNAAARKPPLPPGSRLLKLTSGSTGRPKALVWSEDNLIADARNICATMGILQTDLNLGAIPFSHSYGLSNLVTPLILQGTAVVISNEYLPLSILNLANEHRCSVAPLIPMVFDHLASLPAEDGRFTTIRTFLSAGAPLRASTSRRFHERFGLPIHSFYGCSEVGGIAYDRDGAAAERGSVGTAMEGVAIEIDSRTSRLQVRSGAVALGVLIDASTFTSLAGQFTTDDEVAVSDQDELVLTGRAGEFINTAGKKVNPREVESVILEIDGVREVKVYGEDAGARGEVVAAVVAADPEVTRDAIREFCRLRLSSHKVPRIIKLIDRIPIDARGKVRRDLLTGL